MTLLFVDCCISQRGRDSRTRRLAEAYLEAVRRAHPEVRVETVNLEKLELLPLDQKTLDRRDGLAMAGEFSDPLFEQARRFQEADRIVVAAPFWDLSFPAVLRIYMEHISANGLSYHYDEQGCHGDCRAEQLVYLTTGGDFQRENSLGVLYWQQLCAMFGIDRYDYVFAGGLDAVPEQAEGILAEACEKAARLANDL